MADPSTGGRYSEVFEEATDSRQGQNIHHIRANSSIMKVKKILGETSNTAVTLSMPLRNSDCFACYT